MKKSIIMASLIFLLPILCFAGLQDKLKGVLGRKNSNYCVSCPDTSKGANTICEVPNGTADGMCGWTIIDSHTGDVDFAYACDDTAALGCKDIPMTSCIRLLQTDRTEIYSDLVTYKTLDAGGFVGDVYIQFYVKILGAPGDNADDALDPGHDIEIFGISATEPDSTGTDEEIGDYTGNIYFAIMNNAGNLQYALFYHVDPDGDPVGGEWLHVHTTGTIAVDGTTWTPVRIWIHNGVGATDSVQLWVDYNNDGDFDDAGETIAIVDSLTFDRLLKYIYLGQGNLPRKFDTQITGLKVSTTAMPSGCVR